MNTRFLAILNVIIDAVDRYLSTVQPQFIHSLRKSFKSLILFVITLCVLIFSTWALLLAFGFFELIALGLTHIQALFLLLGVNLTLLLIVIVWFRCIKKRILSLRRSGIAVILSYTIRAINKLRNKRP